MCGEERRCASWIKKSGIKIEDVLQIVYSFFYFAAAAANRVKRRRGNLREPP